jgi:hypothetical protein
MVFMASRRGASERKKGLRLLCRLEQGVVGQSGTTSGPNMQILTGMVRRIIEMAHW